MIIGYARVSSSTQNLDRQIQELEKFGCDFIFTEKKSGKNFKERKEYRKMRKKLRFGDVLVIHDLSRFGRNKEEIKNEWYSLMNDKIDIVVLDMPILDTRKYKNLNGIENLIYEIVFSVLSWIVEDERNRIKESQHKGIEIAKKKGKFKGRPLKYHSEATGRNKLIYNTIIDGLKNNISVMDIHRKTGVSRNTIYKIKKEMEWIIILNKYITTLDNLELINIVFLLLIAGGLYVIYRLIKAVIKYFTEKRLLEKLSKSGIKDIDKMDGHQFEIYLKSLLKELGYKAEVTKGSHDFGADLIMKRNGKKIVVQAKRYGYKNNVSLDAIQQIYASLPYYKASEAWVITNSFFTKNANILAKACNVKLYDRHKLINFINEINPTTTAKHVFNTVKPQKRKCPVCSNDLIQRKNSKGNYFMGCTKFPDCKHTESIANWLALKASFYFPK